MAVFIMIAWLGLLYLTMGSDLTSDAAVIYTGLCIIAFTISMKD